MGAEAARISRTQPLQWRRLPASPRAQSSAQLFSSRRHYCSDTVNLLMNVSKRCLRICLSLEALIARSMQALRAHEQIRQRGESNNAIERQLYARKQRDDDSKSWAKRYHSALLLPSTREHSAMIVSREDVFDPSEGLCASESFHGPRRSQIGFLLWAVTMTQAALRTFAPCVQSAVKIREGTKGVAGTDLHSTRQSAHPCQQAGWCARLLRT